MNDQATKMKENMTDYQVKKLEKLLFSLDQLKKREEEIQQRAISLTDDQYSAEL